MMFIIDIIIKPMPRDITIKPKTIEGEPLERRALKVYSLFVLYFLLTKGPMSGYTLAQLIKERSYGHFRATAGNIYPPSRTERGGRRPRWGADGRAR